MAEEFYKCCIFEEVAKHTIQAAQKAAERMNYAPHAVICQKHHRPRGLYIVAKGTVETVKKDSGGRKLPLSLLAEGDIFGAVALFGEQRDMEADVCAGSRGCSVDIISQTNFLRLLQMDSKLCENYMAYLCGRIRFLSARIDAMFGSDAKSKVLAYLYAHEIAKEVILERNMEKLAAQLSISRASLYRILSQLCEEKIIEKKGNHIIFL